MWMATRKPKTFIIILSLKQQINSTEGEREKKSDDAIIQIACNRIPPRLTFRSRRNVASLIELRIKHSALAVNRRRGTTRRQQEMLKE